eukprot:scaffold149099_cov15-Tisochrysis_lutea.AAC.2
MQDERKSSQVPPLTFKTHHLPVECVCLRDLIKNPRQWQTDGMGSESPRTESVSAVRWQRH